MTEIIRDIRLYPGESLSRLPEKAAKKAGIRKNEIKIWRILRRSLDARKKNDIHYTCSVEISSDPGAFGPEWIPGTGAGGSALPRRCRSTVLLVDTVPSDSTNRKYSIPVNTACVNRSIEKDSAGINHRMPEYGADFRSAAADFSLSGPSDGAAFTLDEPRPVIAGFGPAGMFAGLTLARAGLRPVILERGQCVEDRSETVARFRKIGVLDPESNAQFGEGGAGTFSDGKLNTGTHDGRIGSVLLDFYRHGAPETVLYDAKPHIGTDVLVNVVKSIREEILSLGGEIRFGHRLEKLMITEESGNTPKLTGVSVLSADGTSYMLPCKKLILAVGHSARDTFETLYGQGIPMERKAFSMGARIEHLQSDIDKAQYGKEHSGSALPAADYSLSVHLPDGSSAYTFCMCPGGYVFAAASEEGGICTNGMSYSGRSGVNANSALLVTLQPEDFPGDGVLAGMNWQREIERKAYAYSSALRSTSSDRISAEAVPEQISSGNVSRIISSETMPVNTACDSSVAHIPAYAAPCQLVGDFLENRLSTGPGKVLPAYLPGVVWGDLRQVLPEKITSVMAAAIPELDKKLAGFASPDAVLTGPETRSSSPVRILRDKDCMSDVEGLFPCGEGAGYAGGITSAAVDGIRCAEAVIAFL